MPKLRARKMDSHPAHKEEVQGPHTRNLVRRPTIHATTSGIHSSDWEIHATRWANRNSGQKYCTIRNLHQEKLKILFYTFFNLWQVKKVKKVFSTFPNVEQTLQHEMQTRKTHKWSNTHSHLYSPYNAAACADTAQMLVNMLKPKDDTQDTYKSKAHKEQSGRCSQMTSRHCSTHALAPINSAKACITRRWPKMPWGRRWHS